MALSPPPSAFDIRTIAPLLQCLLTDPTTLLSLSQTCAALHGLADHEQVWQSVAEACWGHMTVGRGGYRTYKGLVLDDNRCNAALALVFCSTACAYRFQRPLAFYECRLLQLQWWRTANSLRLYFDARGEADLRLPLDSSIAVVRLNDGHTAATAAAEACCSCRQLHQQTAGPAGAASAAAPSAAAGAAACTGCFDLDALGTRLLVQAPDACHTFVQKPGHYKGVLIWHAAKTTQLLKALLLQHPADSNAPPAQQHSHLAVGRRSEAWEEWAEWQLEHDAAGSAEALTGSSSSGGGGGGGGGGSNNALSSSSSSGHNSAMQGQRSASFSALFRSYFGHRGHTPATSGSGDPSSEPVQSALQSETGNRQQQPQQAPRHALLFCYANDLKWYHTMRTPDYSITPLAVAQPVPGTAAPSQAAAQQVCPSPQGRPYKQRGQVSKHMVCKGDEAVVLSKKEEGRLAYAWRQLPGACMQQCGALDQQLQAEGCVQEKTRWAGLPAAVKARGEGWWV